MEGVLIVDKPSGLTSHDVVDRVRSRLGIRRVGHAGTLDPMATGVLVILVGKATKLAEQYLNDDKEYLTEITLGKETETGDGDGKILKEEVVASLALNKIEKTLKGFEGESLQTPHPFSAVHHKGRKLYEWARKGVRIHKDPRKIRIETIELLQYRHPIIDLRIACSKGTYIRKLAEDIATSLGTVGYLSTLRRTRSGSFTIDEAVLLDKVTHENLQRPRRSDKRF